MYKAIQIKRRLAALCVWAMIGSSACAALGVQPDDEACMLPARKIQEIESLELQETSGADNASTGLETPESPPAEPETPATPSTEPEPEAPEAPPIESEPEAPAAPPVESKPEAPSTPPAEPETPDIPSYTVTLGPCTIGAGESKTYTTISPEFAGGRLPEGYYPGNLTIELGGTVTIEAGGLLAIGPLSVGSDSEAHPVVRGTLSDIGLIVVKAGGSLDLTCVQTELSGHGVLIVQEPGASVNLNGTSIDDNLIVWAAPVVNNQQDAPDTVWLPVGQTLTADQLPRTLRTNLQYLGSETREDIATEWDLSTYDGRTSGEIELSGVFVDADGRALDSVVPLTLTVVWYQPERITVTGTRWRGEEACTAELTVLALPAQGTVWGETSRDGVNWSRWAEFEVLTDDNGVQTCIFFDTDPDTQLYYRVAAQDGNTMRMLVSDGYLLPDEIGSDQGGNRGGGTAFHPPARHPSTVRDEEDETSEENEEEETLADLSALREWLGWDGLLSSIQIPSGQIDPDVSEPTAEQPAAVPNTTPLQVHNLAERPAAQSIWQAVAGQVDTQHVQPQEPSAPTDTHSASALDTPSGEQTQTASATPSGQTQTASAEQSQTVLAGQQPSQADGQTDGQTVEAVPAKLPVPGLPKSVQVLLAAVGLLACAAIGFILTRVLRRK